MASFVGVEMLRCRTLTLALSGRDDRRLLPLLKFVEIYLDDPLYSLTLLDVSDMIMYFCCGEPFFLINNVY